MAEESWNLSGETREEQEADDISSQEEELKCCSTWGAGTVIEFKDIDGGIFMDDNSLL